METTNELPNPTEFMKLGEDAFNKNVHEKLRETLSPTEKQMWINGYLLALTEQSYSVEDLECAWNSSDQNMRFQFSSSAYKGITFKQWLEKYEHER